MNSNYDFVLPPRRYGLDGLPKLNMRKLRKMPAWYKSLIPGCDDPEPDWIELPYPKEPSRESVSQWLAYLIEWVKGVRILGDHLPESSKAVNPTDAEMLWQDTATRINSRSTKHWVRDVHWLLCSLAASQQPAFVGLKTPEPEDEGQREMWRLDRVIKYFRACERAVAELSLDELREPFCDETAATGHATVLHASPPVNGQLRSGDLRDGVQSTLSEPKIPRMWKRAYDEYLFATEKLGEKITDDEAYNWVRSEYAKLKENDSKVPLLHKLSTWKIYVSKARSRSGKRKNQPRVGREARSVIRTDQI